MTILKAKDAPGYTMQCDACSAYVTCETANDYSEVNAQAKEQGFINRQINGQWFNFCSEECFQRKKEELGVDLVSEKFDSQLLIDSAQAKINCFKEELEHVSDAHRHLAECLISELPDYYFEIAASSTGKYHPSYTNGKGGLVRHTKAAVRIAIELLRLEMYQALAPYKDHIIIALMLHDGWKHGLLKEDGTYAQYTKAEHPKICAEWLMTQTNLTDEQTLKTIADLVLTHMGQWNMSYNNGLIFAPKPSTMGQCFVHLCDYLASRKSLEFNFDVPFGV